jgi:P4 family phage/plasmid primase-like protien
MSSIVLKIPIESQSFRAALTDATIRDRVLEWTTAAVTLDDAVYIPLRTDWMPPRDRRTADGVEVLLAGRWPPEVDAESGPRVSAAIFGRVWGIVCDASPTEENKDIATCGLSGVNEEQTENEAQEEAPVVIRIHATPVNHVDGWSWSHVVTEIRRWADIYPDPLPDPNDISEAEARALLKTIYQHPAVIAEFERRRMVAEATQREYRDARTIQYAIDVGVDLPDPTPPPVTQEFPCTDDGNGDRLVAQYRDSIRYCKTFDAWYLWSGSRWERDETCRMLALAKRVARTIHIEASATTDDRREKVGKWALTSGMLSRLRAMIACAAPAVAVTPEEFDARPELLNCKNGTLELDTLTFREARREDLLTKCCGVDYDPAATCPGWLAHLDLVFGGDAAYIRGFQELCGYSLLQENPEQIMAILYGIGKNGKSVTIGALARVWGDYAVNIAAESLMVRRGDGPRSDLARLHGARLVTASEGESGAYLAESVVKQLTGDDAITVRRLYENEFEFRPGAKIFLATNHEPRIRGTDEGIWRRLWLLPFTVTIPEDGRDPGILDKLEAEGSGILNWCIEGLRRYQANGCRLAPPAKVVAATARFRSESDMVGRFLAQAMKTDPMGTIERTALYKIYLKWCEDEGERPVSNRAVIKYLRERGFGERKLGGAMCWTGIRIKSTTEAEEDATEGSSQAGL